MIRKTCCLIPFYEHTLKNICDLYTLYLLDKTFLLIMSNVSFFFFGDTISLANKQVSLIVCKTNL